MNEKNERNKTTATTSDRIWRSSIGEIRVYTKNGQCAVIKPATMIAPRGGEVLWRVFNDCGHSHAIGVEFPAEKDPLELCTLKWDDVPPHKMRPIPCRVRDDGNNDPPDDSYPYQVDVDGELLDPELEVRGPLTESEKEPPPRRDTVEVQLTARRPKPRTAKRKTSKASTVKSKSAKAKGAKAKSRKAKAARSRTSKTKSSKSKRAGGKKRKR